MTEKEAKALAVIVGDAKKLVERIESERDVVRSLNSLCRIRINVDDHSNIPQVIYVEGDDPDNKSVKSFLLDLVNKRLAALEKQLHNLRVPS